MYKMLIVDDEKTERECIRYLTEEKKLPLELKEASCGSEALLLLRQWPADILFTDVQMPGMTGLELLKQARLFLPRIRSVIFSGYAEFEYARTAMTLGAENYLLKPVVPEELIRILEKVLRELAQEESSRQEQDRQQAFLLQYALQSYLNTGTRASFSPELSAQLNAFRQLVLLDFPETFLEKNYAELYGSLRACLLPDMETLNLSPSQALLFLRSSKRDTCALGEEIFSYLSKTFHTDCCVSVSAPFRSSEGLLPAYAQVEQQMEQRFFSPQTRVFFPEFSPQSEGNSQGLDDEALLSLIRRSLSGRDSAALLRNLENLFDKYSSPSCQSQIFVKFVFSNLITALYPFLPKQGAESQGFKSLDEMITELYLQPDLQRIIQLARTLAGAILKDWERHSPDTRREISAVRDYIDHNFGQDLSTEQLASRVCLTPDYLSRLFKKSTGKSLSQYIRQVRMEQASALLLSTARKVIDIGMEVGYPNYSYFCQSFREYFGKSPEKYRQEGAQI